MRRKKEGNILSFFIFFFYYFLALVPRVSVNKHINKIIYFRSCKDIQKCFVKMRKGHQLTWPDLLQQSNGHKLLQQSSMIRTFITNLSIPIEI